MKKIKTRTMKLRNMISIILLVFYIGIICLCMHTKETGEIMSIVSKSFGEMFILIVALLEIMCLKEPKFYNDYLIYKNIKISYTDIREIASKTEKWASAYDSNPNGSHEMTKYYFIAYKVKKIMIPITIDSKDVDKLNGLEEDLKRQLKKRLIN